MKKQEKFEEIYIKFVRKCLNEDIMPVVALQYEVNGVFPILKYIEVDKKRKEEILSSLNEEK